MPSALATSFTVLSAFLPKYTRSKIPCRCLDFRDLFREFERRLSPEMRQRYVVGDKLFVDYTGNKVPIVDLVTEIVPEAEIFVGMLGTSRPQPAVSFAPPKDL